MKRKDFEGVYDDLSCFSMAESARKSRRLEYELPLKIEEVPGSGAPVAPEVGFLNEGLHSGEVMVPSVTPIVVVDALMPKEASQELAIVLYNPENAASRGLVKSPSSSNLSLVMNSEFLSNWRNHMLHQGNQSSLTITELDDESEENKSFQSNNSMAVVPWMASQQHPHAATPEPQSTVMSVEPMEADADCEMMETDDNSTTPGYISQGYIFNNGSINNAQPLPQQQPHCLMPQYSPNTYTPVLW